MMVKKKQWLLKQDKQAKNGGGFAIAIMYLVIGFFFGWLLGRDWMRELCLEAIRSVTGVR